MSPNNCFSIPGWVIERELKTLTDAEIDAFVLCCRLARTTAPITPTAISATLTQDSSPLPIPTIKTALKGLRKKGIIAINNHPNRKPPR